MLDCIMLTGGFVFNGIIIAMCGFYLGKICVKVLTR